MRLILIFILTLFSFNVSAKKCEKIELSELESFPKKELIDRYCKYKKTVTESKMESYERLKEAVQINKIADIRASEKIMNEVVGEAMVSCRIEQERVNQILKSKYKIENKEIEHCYIPEMLMGLDGEP